MSMVCYRCKKEGVEELFKTPIKCIDCAKRDVRYAKKYRGRNKDSIRKYYRNWYKKNGRNRAPDYDDKMVEWQKDNPKKVTAGKLLREQVRRGNIIKPKRCFGCGEEHRLSGHHPDYSKPLAVEWLCSSCHKLKHSTKA